MKRTILHSSILAVLSLLPPLSAQAALIVQEEFAYGGSNLDFESNYASFNGGTGFTGQWQNGAIVSGIVGTYQATGLTLGSLSVSGGSLQTVKSTQANQWSVYSRPLDATAQTAIDGGAVYGSFLFNVTTRNNVQTASGVLLGGSGDSTAASAGLMTDRSGDDLGSLQSESSASAMSGTAAPLSTTFIFLSEMNLSLGTSPTISGWILDQAQFENFKIGGLTATELNAASLGTGSTNVYQRSSLTGTAAPDDVDFLNLGYFMQASGQNITITYDELRFSNTSLDEVTPVPEPSTWALLGLGFASLFILRRRRRPTL